MTSTPVHAPFIAGEAPRGRVLSRRLVFWILIGLMVLVLLLGLGTLAIYKLSVDAQRARIARIEELGGSVSRTRPTRDEHERSPLRFLGEGWEPPAAEAIVAHAPVNPEFATLAREAGRVPGVQAMSFPGAPLSDTQLAALANRRSLVFLGLAGTDVTDAGLVSLSNCPSLQRVDLRLTEITDHGIDAVSQIKSLAHVDLRHTRVTDMGAARLRKALPAATVLSQNVPHEQHLKVLREVGRRGGLWRLYGGDGADDEITATFRREGNWAGFDWRSLEEVEGLTGVNFEEIELPSAALVSLANRGQLEWLFFSDCQITASDVEQLGDFATLKHLTFHDCQLDWSALRTRIGQFQQLETLHLEKVDVDSKTWAALVGLPKLKCLRLDGCRLDNDALANVPLPVQMQTLSLRKTNLTDNGFQSIARLRNLTMLEISKTEVTDASLDAMLSLGKLEILDIAETKISADGKRKLEASLKAQVFYHPSMPGIDN